MMNNSYCILGKTIHLSVLAMVLCTSSLAQAASVELATSPLATSTTSSVKPNLLFVLDNSLSMDWDHMPDEASDAGSNVTFQFDYYGLRSSQCNQVYYNPSLTYRSPIKADGTSYTDATFTSAKGGNQGGYSASSTAVNLSTGFKAPGDSTGSMAYYYAYTGDQDTLTEKNYHSTTNTFYNECNSTQNSATGLAVFNKVILSNSASATSATITVSGSTSTSVSSILLNGTEEIMSGTTAASTSNSTLATSIATQINLCTTLKTGNCTSAHGYTATAVGGVITLTGLTNSASKLKVTRTGTMTFTSVITVAASADQLTNFANWYSFYRTRMLMMKTATGHAFSNLNSSYRIGMMKISATDPVVGMDTFETTHRSDWYSALYGMTTSGSTPLRRSLADAGRYYAGQLSADPVQYSCQQNFTILSTDGYWNDGSGYKINGSTAVGNQDGIHPRPFYDGSTLTSARNTSQRTKTQTQVTRTTTQNQQREQISETSNLQLQISQLRQDIGTLQYRTSQLEYRTGTLQGTRSKVLMRCNDTAAACGTAPSSGVNTGNWFVVTSGSCTPASSLQCSIVSGLSGSVNVSSTCNTTATVSSTPATDGSIVITVSGASTTVSTKLSSLQIDGIEVLTATTSGTTGNANVASKIQAKVGNGFTVTRSSAVLTIKKASITSASTISYTVSAGSATLTASSATSGTSASYTLNNADSNGNIYSACSYSWGGWTGASSCTVNKSTANPYTVTSATECQYATWSGWIDAGASCTPAAQDTVSPHTVGTATECQYSWLTAQATPSCSTPAYVVGNYSNTTVYKSCAASVTSPYTNVASCTVSATPDASGNTTQCQYSAWINNGSPTACTDVPQDTTDPYDMSATGGVATRCTDTGWVGVNSCTGSSSTGFLRTCQTVNTGPTLVSSCTSAGKLASNDYTQTSCSTSTVLSATPVSTCTDEAASAANNYVTTSCNTVTSGPTVGSCTASAASASNSWTTTTCTSAVSGGGTSDNLADIAMYYYQTDLRTSDLSNCTGSLGNDVCENNVFIGGNDSNTQQHMTTFTLGLGASGWMNYSSSYLTDTTGNYHSVKTLTSAPSTECPWQTTGTECNWPFPGLDTSTSPASGYIANIDDLWHAAVNGRGAYFSATDPYSLSTGLSNALAGINARKGAAAAAATSTLNPVAGNNYAFVASYTTLAWKGNLEARGINTITGAVNENADWCVENVVAGTCASPSTVVAESAGSTTTYYCVTPSSVTCNGGILDGTNCKIPVATTCTGTMNTKVADVTDTRVIKTPNSGGTALVDFAYANLTATQQGYFSAAHIGTLTQWSTLTATQQSTAVGATLVNYLRGQYGYDDRNTNPLSNRLFRYREAVLGDALESEPAFIGAPVFSYPYPGYSTYKTDQASRAGTVYMGANDGMMHAIASDTGIERWAYVPSMVMSNMWKLADTSYATQHSNFVNGSPITSDVCTANCTDASTAVWKTILVAGLNGGGRGYFALDITDPANPQLLWELTTTSGMGKVTDDDVGYGFGHPIITRKQDGTWVVVLTSGYNNTSPGDGKGYLYVLNAASGSIISKISTGVGSTTTPSGFSHIAGWNNESSGNLVGYIYGGDLQGNLWRFDINSTATATIGTGSAMKFASLFSNPSGTQTQPITTTPVLGKINEKRVIFIGTGKYLETGDLTNTQTQSIYAIKDDDATATLVNPRNTLVNQTLTSNVATATRTGSNVSVNFYTGRGWFIDLPDSGERVNIDSTLVQGTLIVPTIVPSNTACSPGGYGWLNYFNYMTGGAIDVNSALVSEKTDSTIVGVNVLYIGGTPKIGVVTSTNPTPTLVDSVQFAANAPTFTGKRVIWRELIPQ
jgi:type IV pilus assembly protein PilY1